MNLTQFQTLSKRTMPFGGEPNNNVEFENMLGNYAMGLVGETIEALEKFNSSLSTQTDLLDFMKELGDISHYIVGLAAIAHVELPEHIDLENHYSNRLTPGENMDILLCEAGLTVEHAKKVIYHRHTFSAFEINAIEILTLVKALAKAHNFKFSEVLKTNVNKLKTRYPEKFTVEDSIKRVDVNG